MKTLRQLTYGHSMKKALISHFLCVSILRGSGCRAKSVHLTHAFVAPVIVSPTFLLLFTFVSHRMSNCKS